MPIVEAKVLYLLCATLFTLGIAMLGSACTTTEKEIETEEGELLSSKEEITIINVYDNFQVNPKLATGWGFGCVIKTPTETILFDTGGNSSTLLSNMEMLGINPEEIEIIVISHIHGDHVGGLNGFLERNGKVKVYIPASFSDSWRKKIESYGAQYEDIKAHQQIGERVHTTGEMGTWIKEQSLVLDTDKGLVIITGCAHPGVINIARSAQQMLSGRRIYLIMGGFHLSGASDSELKRIIETFRDMGVQKVAPSHCSGERCRELFHKEYGDEYIRGGVGCVITL